MFQFYLSIIPNKAEKNLKKNKKQGNAKHDLTCVIKYM